MPGRPPCPDCGALLLLVRVAPLKAEVCLHRYECMGCDYVQEKSALEKAKPAGGWVLHVKPAA